MICKSWFLFVFWVRLPVTIEDIWFLFHIGSSGFQHSSQLISQWPLHGKNTQTGVAYMGRLTISLAPMSGMCISSNSHCSRPKRLGPFGCGTYICISRLYLRHTSASRHSYLARQTGSVLSMLSTFATSCSWLSLASRAPRPYRWQQNTYCLQWDIS